MPELPEVEMLRRELDKEVVGKKVKTVEVKGMAVIARHPNKKHFVQKLEGAKITSLARKGSYLLLGLDTEDVLVAHLGANGQLRRSPNKAAVEKGTQFTITFTQHGQLRYIDPSKGGDFFVTPAETLEQEVPELSDLGIDPVDEPVSWTSFGEMLLARRMKLKSLLMDRTLIAGIGPVYSDEILFSAGLRYDRDSDSLSTQEIRRLYRALVETLHDAIKHGGSSGSDDDYASLHGESGDYQDLFKVYDREGDACRRCRSPIHKSRFSKASVFYCDQCQV